MQRAVHRLRKHRLALAVLSSLLAGSLPAIGAFSDSTASAIGLGPDEETLDDAALGNARGRFTTPMGVVGLGVEMVSRWVTADGQVLTAGASMTVGAQGAAQRQVGFVPTAYVSAVPTPSEAAATAGKNPAAAPVPGGERLLTGADPSGNISGVGQVIQLAGDRNQVTNELRLRLMPAQGGNVPGVESTVAARSTDGQRATAQSSIGRDGVTVSLDLSGVGSVRQTIGSAGAGGLHQSVRLAGDQQSVRNLTDVTVYMQQMSLRSLAQTGILQMLQTRSMLGR